MLYKWLLPNTACKRAGMHYSMSFHPGLRLCAQWLRKLCQGGIKWKFWQAADLRKFILRLLHLLLNQMKGLCIFELCNEEEELLISNF